MAVEKVNIKDVCSEIFAGGDAPKNRMSIEKTAENTIPIYSNGEDRDGLYGYTDFARVSLPSITISARGTIGYASIRKEPFVPIVRLITITPIPELIDIHYLYHAIRNFNFSGSGTSIPQLTVPMIKQYSFPLPPLDKQRKIAAVLDKVSSLIAKRRQQLDKLDEMVKARFVEMFGDPETNTKNWRVLPMSKICSVGSSKRIYQSEQSSSGVPFWRISDLTSLITTGTVTPELYIPEERYKELKTQGQVPAPGDILITSRGTLGQCYIVKVNDRFYFQDGMISWLSGYMDGVTPLYISYLFTMPGFRKQIDSMQAGSTVAYLSITMIKKLKVMLPDIESQQQFASFVSKTEKTKTIISCSLEKLKTLKKALMQEYFG